MLTGGGPFSGSTINGGGDHLLINYTLRVAFTPASQQMGLASAIAMLIFVIVGSVSAYGSGSPANLRRSDDDRGHVHRGAGHGQEAQGRQDAVRALDAHRRLAPHRRDHHGHLGALPVLYVITLAFSGGNNPHRCLPPSKTGLGALSCLIPSTFSLDNFTTILTSDQWPFAVWFRNTVVLATLNSFLALLMVQPAAFAFSRLRFKGRRMGLLLLMLVQMFPAVLALTAIFILLQAIGDVFPMFGLRSIWGLLLVYLGGALGCEHLLDEGLLRHIRSTSTSRRGSTARATSRSSSG